ncbi:MAG: cell division protein ZapA [Sphingomonas sp.]|jgi:cell division protein ZapA
MADVTLRIGHREHRIACAEGSQAQLRRMAALLDARWAQAQQASGGLDDERTLLFVALMLADELDETLQRNPAETGGASAATLAALADRLERVAMALEETGQTP